MKTLKTKGRLTQESSQNMERNFVVDGFTVRKLVVMSEMAALLNSLVVYEHLNVVIFCSKEKAANLQYTLHKAYCYQ